MYSTEFVGYRTYIHATPTAVFYVHLYVNLLKCMDIIIDPTVKLHWSETGT